MEDFRVPFALHEECSRISLGYYYFSRLVVEVYLATFSEYSEVDARSQMESSEIHYYFHIFFVRKPTNSLFKFYLNYL